MKREYYRIAFNVIPNMCSPITYTVAVSETFENFIERNSDKYQSIQVILICPCSIEDYNIHSSFNPKNSFVKLLKRDRK